MTDRVVEPKKKVTAKASKETQDGATNREATDKSKKRKAPQHVDDEDYDLDLNTGRFVKCKKVLTLEDDDIEMEEQDDEDKDKDYDPDKDDDLGDDDEQENNDADNDDDDDFQEPPLKSRKQAVKISNSSKSKRKKQKTSDDALEDLADFVEETFTKRTTCQGSHKARAEKEDDACINPKEAARFRKAMRDKAQELEKAVKKGVNMKKAYETLITHIIEACKNMNYEIPTDLEASDILPAVEDPTCRAWQLKMQGVQTAGEGELNVSKADNAGICVAKKKFEIQDIAQYVSDMMKDWTPLKKKNLGEVI